MVLLPEQTGGLNGKSTCQPSCSQLRPCDWFQPMKCERGNSTTFRSKYLQASVPSPWPLFPSQGDSEVKYRDGNVRRWRGPGFLIRRQVYRLVSRLLARNQLLLYHITEIWSFFIPTARLLLTDLYKIIEQNKQILSSTLILITTIHMIFL